MQFLRHSGRELVRPELLGLPPTTGTGERSLERGAALLKRALLAGDGPACRQIILDLWLAGHRVSAIGDRVMARAFDEIGDAWACGDAEVYQERRACELCFRVLLELGMTLPDPKPEAPSAVGGSTEGDPYQLPTKLVELVFRERGWQATSLGNLLPFATLKAAVKDLRPRLVWASASHLIEAEDFLTGYADFYEAASAANVAVVVGGKSLTENLRCRMQYSAFCDTLAHLETFLDTFESRTASSAQATREK